MAATDNVIPRLPAGIPEITVKNTSGSNLPAGSTVKIDPSNPMAASLPIGVVGTILVADMPFGVLTQSIAAGAIGNCAVIDGTVVTCIALGAIAAGATVGPCTTLGQVTTYTAANPSLGIAVTAAANAADPISVMLAKSMNH